MLIIYISSICSTCRIGSLLPGIVNGALQKQNPENAQIHTQVLIWSSSQISETQEKHVIEDNLHLACVGCTVWSLPLLKEKELQPHSSSCCLVWELFSSVEGHWNIHCSFGLVTICSSSSLFNLECFSSLDAGVQSTFDLKTDTLLFSAQFSFFILEHFCWWDVNSVGCPFVFLIKHVRSHGTLWCPKAQ